MKFFDTEIEQNGKRYYLRNCNGNTIVTPCKFKSKHYNAVILEAMPERRKIGLENPTAQKIGNQGYGFVFDDKDSLRVFIGRLNSVFERM